MRSLLLLLFPLQRADYNRFKGRMSNGVNGGLDLPVMIGLPWLVVLLASVVAVPPGKTTEKISQAEEQITQGMDWTRKGDAQLAISSFDEAIKLAPEMAQAYHQRGKAYSILDQREQAIQDFDEAIRLDLQNAQAFFSRGMSLDVLGEYQRAKSDYDEAIKLGPDDGVAYYNRAIVHTRLGMDREAQAVADRADGLGFDPSLLENAMNAARAER